MRHIRKEINQRYVCNYFARLDLFGIEIAFMKVKVLIRLHLCMLRLIFCKLDHIA